MGPLSNGEGEQTKVPDGMRYHVLDVWAEELIKGIEDTGGGEGEGEAFMEPVRALEREGKGKVLRRRAGEVVWVWEGWKGRREQQSEEEEWNGFEDQ